MSAQLQCGVCGGALVTTIHDDGARSWRCPCGKTHGYSGVEGELDLGIVREETPMGTPLRDDLARNNFELFFEEFASTTDIGIDAMWHDPEEET